ncbi:hypothetical protein [Streptomyces sp. TS71-3]|uniref:hypothetical protein n=1 Tax=Streptomyces sp. TS71-3 TaxID=2733862 RepID=UPI001BB3F1EB|nr:hypothetical protein [Streptomyces sp. TS71-3]
MQQDRDDDRGQYVCRGHDDRTVQTLVHRLVRVHVARPLCVCRHRTHAVAGRCRQPPVETTLCRTADHHHDRKGVGLPDAGKPHREQDRYCRQDLAPRHGPVGGQMVRDNTQHRSDDAEHRRAQGGHRRIGRRRRRGHGPPIVEHPPAVRSPFFLSNAYVSSA